MDEGLVTTPVPGDLDAAFLDGRHLDDAYLVRRAQQGSPDAFEVLVARHRDQVYRVAHRLVGESAAAEDVAQDALVSAWRALPSFRGDAAFSTWLHRITTNAARQLLTRRRPVDPLTGEEPVPPSEHPDAQVVDAERTRALRAAVRALPFDQRAALVLVQFEGLSYLEAARVLEVSEPTLRGRIARARRSLLDTMRGWQ
ncbi:RNA polymerase sigma factor [Geodermatophilus sp. Leaf369]|uniref:RNA polymerase sigma factor n=1 Tax=Geodermatophilus sp. Leaf369 TaxID=1736354 RepID=UPI00138F5550|nr:sigma-70 family RNA polymerase sigma factor [Geodermatophilus sp. Leaf369]